MTAVATCDIYSYVSTKIQYAKKGDRLLILRDTEPIPVKNLSNNKQFYANKNQIKHE